MNDEPGTIEGDVHLAYDLRLYGRIQGTLTVGAGAQFILHGIVEGNLILEPSSRAEVYGTVWGDVINRGGELLVVGHVRGYVARAGGFTRIDSRAVVAGGFA